MMTPPQPDNHTGSRSLLALLATVVLLATACSSDSANDQTVVGQGYAADDGIVAGATDPDTTDPDTTNPDRAIPDTAKAGATTADEKDCRTTGEFDPANFVSPTQDTNPYQPLKAGIQWVRGGSTLVGGREVPHQVISTMSDVIRVIEGVPTVAMLDESTDSGEVAQIGMDYLALDKDGNVWLLGGYTEEYEGGQYTNTEDHWLGTVGGSSVGILAPAEVTSDTAQWCIGGSEEDAPTVGKPVKIGISECVEFGCYENVRLIQEGEVGAPDNEHKYYAQGIGVIRNIPLNASLHKDRFELMNFVQLSSEGLAQVSQTVLDLEAHARETAPAVYGDAPESQRAS
jgi:hypothetical protein